METDEVMHQLDTLQEKVEHLIEQCQALQRNNTDLQAKVQQLESELDQKTEAENQFLQQKTQIRSRIDDLLAKLNNAAETPSPEE
ncbi:putative RNase H-like nuclease (RuvC/YqgF family) [Desulfosalsimonas propionicica]|uniref:Putative RNase H-like nuclease (RuvC/YqgF family) n=1 Tax=Desulfosalsimonas propionicica TaxID=332175 RepID=A0A7W0CAV0_9BACT|nr:putative RNase H-like nuclease (RuvC/YqgF family) [Desulfosalsimonas propionicica]